MRAIAGAVLGLGLALAPAATAQPAGVTWQKIIPVNGDRGEAVVMALTAEGNVVVGGSLTKRADFRQGEANDAWLAMFAPDGTQIWSRQFGGDARDDIADLTIGVDGAIFVTGARDTYRRQSGQVVNGFAAKFSTDGELVWDNIIREPERHINTFHVMTTPDGGVVLSGNETRAGDGGSSPLVVKLTADGAISWRTTPKPVSAPAASGFVAVSADGRRFSSDRARLAAVNERGVEVSLLRNTLDNDMDLGCVVLDLADGTQHETTCSTASLNGFRQRVDFSGWRTRSFDASDPVIERSDGDGNVLWTRILASEPSDGLFDVAATPDGGVVGVGFQLTGPRVERHNWDGLIVRLDADGNELWRRQMGGSKRDELRAVEILPDGSIVVAGFTGSQGDAIDWAPWIMRLNPQGLLEGDALADMEDKQF